MIIVLGSFVSQAAKIDEAIALSLQHCARSRAEPGCLAHAMHRDFHEPLRLRFIEKWADRAALATHFAVPATREFVRSIGALARSSDGIEILEASVISRKDVTG